MANQYPAETPTVNPDIVRELAKSKVQQNLVQNIFTTTEDWATICLMKYQKALKDEDVWVLPAGIFLTIVLTMVSANFHSFLGLDADTIRGFFLFVAVAAFIWLVKALYQLYRTRGRRSVAAVVKALQSREELP